MLRVVYLLESSALFGGVKVVLLQAEALARRGNRVAVVCPEPAPDWFSLTQAHYERSSFRESRELAAADVRVATFWTTVAPAVEGARGPVFHLCQGYEGDFSFYQDRREAIEAAYRAPTHKLAISAGLAARLVGHGFGPVENVGQAFDGGGFFPAPAGAERKGAPVVLLVGPSQADLKGISIAMEALTLWRENGGAFRLRRISNFPPGEVEKRFPVADEYHYLLPPDRMPSAYRACDLFIGPSRPEEGFGLPALEALSCGLPCLLSDTPGHREMAGDAAWYFRDGDPEALAEALPQLVGEEARRRARVAGPARASRFDTARVAANLERVFCQALAEGS